MKIAYCISAYTDPAQLKRLVESLNPDAHFFIHIDKNSYFEDFNKLVSSKETNIHYVKPIKIRWATISQVEYQMSMLSEATKYPEHFDYIFMLSAFDYPIWSNEKIASFLEDNYGKEFIMGINVQTTFYLKDLQREYRPDFEIKWLPKRINHYLRGSIRYFAKLVNYKKPIKVKLRSGEYYDVYKGSDYFCITRDLAIYIVNMYKNNMDLRKYFANTFAPSETLIHTIAFNSKFKSKCICVEAPYQGLPSLTPLHYIEGCKIKILTEPDFKTLIDSGKMFARKFRSNKSENLIKLLEAHRNSPDK